MLLHLALDLHRKHVSHVIVVVLADKSGSCPSSIFQVLRHFVNDLALGDLETAAKLFAKSSTSPQHETFTPLENEQYNKYVYACRF